MNNPFYHPLPLETLPLYFHVTESTWATTDMTNEATNDEESTDDEKRNEPPCEDDAADPFASFLAVSQQHRAQRLAQAHEQSQASSRQPVLIQKRSEQIAVAVQTYGARWKEIMAIEARLDSMFDAISPQSVLWPSIPLRFE